MNDNRKQFLDDMFDAFALLAGNNYVSLYDIKGSMTRYSLGAVELFGLPGEYIPDGAYNWDDYVHPEDLARYQVVMGDLIKCNRLSYDLSYRTRLRAGGYGLFRYVGAVIRDDDGKPSMVGGMIINEGILENTDSVTVLRNRYGFFDDLSAMKASGQRGIILLIGIREMSAINETNGYGFGNKVLQQAAIILQDTAGNDGIVYRMDGAKFAFVTKKLSMEEVEKIYQQIKQRLQSGIIIDDVMQSIEISGGAFELNDFEPDNGTIYSSIKFVYQESKNKKHGAMVPFGGMRRDSTAEKLGLIDKIRKDMLEECGNFFVEYQPVFRLSDERAIGVEALVRYRDGESGVIYPSEFIPVLEHDYAFEELGIWIMKKVMTDAAPMIEKSPDIVVGINISASQIEDDFFVRSVITAAMQTGFPLKNLCLELTKDCRLLDSRLLKQRTTELKDNDIKILMDDFGSGFSSLEILKDIEAQYVKFDRVFIEGITESEQDKSYLEHLCELAAVRGQTVCVKGVESKEILDIIKHFSISSAQGFALSKPVSADKIIELL